MFKKIVTLFLFLFLFLFSSISFAEEGTSNQYPVNAPTTERHIEQIKWSHNHGYLRGILASYGWFLPAPAPDNFVLPIINTAWEVGYIKGVLEAYEDLKDDER